MNLYGSKQLVESIRTVRKNTILIAEDIPQKDYGYRPAPESRSVAETLVHTRPRCRIFSESRQPSRYRCRSDPSQRQASIAHLGRRLVPDRFWTVVCRVWRPVRSCPL
jgi:hypothetical protein